jgi:hypothetical protein
VDACVFDGFFVVEKKALTLQFKQKVIYFYNTQRGKNGKKDNRN